MQVRLKADIVAVNTLSDKQRRMMYALYNSYYEGCNEALFQHDLSNKQWSIILSDKNDTIRGFTTLFVGEHVIAKQKIRSVFSGDTIIHHDFWGEQALPHVWCRFIGELKAQQPTTPLYWFLIVKGHRTYRYLRIFSKEFYPVYSKPTPEKIQCIMDQLGQDRFGDNYHAESGLIHFDKSHGYLKKQWSGIDSKSLKNRDVHFFLQRNPNYHTGDELVCLTELTEHNLQRYALTAFKEGLNCV